MKKVILALVCALVIILGTTCCYKIIDEKKNPIETVNSGDSVASVSGENNQENSEDIIEDTEKISENVRKNINPENELFKDAKTTERTLRLQSYENALDTFIDIYRLPDGNYEEISDTMYDMSKNNFAITDIDNDGREELLLELSNMPMAGMRTIVYDFDIETLSCRQQFSEFTAMTYFNNGIIVEVLLSHNQGLAGDALWPYALYEYDKETDTYKQIAIVDACSKVYAELFATEAFPTEEDKDGDGVVYYILPASSDEKNAIDGQEYIEWRKQYIEVEGDTIEIEFKALTKENVQSIMSATDKTITSSKGETKTFKNESLELVVTNVKETKKNTRTDGTGEWEEDVYVVYPEAKVYVSNVGMDIYGEDEKMTSYWQFLYSKENGEENTKEIMLGMSPVEITGDLKAVVSENVATLVFEQAID